MKRHLAIRLRRELPQSGQRVPLWKAFIHDKRVEIESFHRSFAQEFASFGGPTWVTNESEPAASIWSSDPAASGLNRIYCIILQRDAKILLLLTHGEVSKVH